MVKDVITNNRILKVSLGILVSIVFVYLFISKVDFTELSNVFTKASGQFICAAIFGLALGYFSRIKRWQYMLKMEEASPDFISCSSAFMKSIAVNNLMPLRAGDIYRMISFPGQVVPRSKLAASVIFERILDMTTLLVLIGIVGVVSEFPINGVDTFFRFSSGILLLVLLLPLWVKTFEKIQKTLRKRNLTNSVIEKIFTIVDDLLVSIKLFLNIKEFTILIVFSVSCWLFEALTFYFVGLSLGISLSWSEVLLVTCVATLSTLIPSSPGYIGTFHFAIISTLIGIGFDESVAGAFAILVHLVLWGSTTFVGLMFFLKSNVLVNGLYEKK